MEKTSSGFYIIDAYSLSKSSGKPYHLAQRFPNYPKRLDALLEAQLKRDALLDAKRQKLAQRSLQVQMVAHNAKEKSELLRQTMEHNLLMADRKRAARLEKLRTSNREMVERAKFKAKQHRLKSIALQETKRQAIDQKMMKSERRRMALQHRTKSQLMVGKVSLDNNSRLKHKSSLPVPMFKRLIASIKVFRKLNLLSFNEMKFQELVRTLKNLELITAAATILAQGKPKCDKKKGRVFLTAFMIASSPGDIFLDLEGSCEQASDHQ